MSVDGRWMLLLWLSAKELGAEILNLSFHDRILSTHLIQHFFQTGDIVDRFDQVILKKKKKKKINE